MENCTDITSNSFSASWPIYHMLCIYIPASTFECNKGWHVTKLSVLWILCSLLLRFLKVTGSHVTPSHACLLQSSPTQIKASVTGVDSRSRGSCWGHGSAPNFKCFHYLDLWHTLIVSSPCLYLISHCRIPCAVIDGEPSELWREENGLCLSSTEKVLRGKCSSSHPGLHGQVWYCVPLLFYCYTVQSFCPSMQLH